MSSDDLKLNRYAAIVEHVFFGESMAGFREGADAMEGFNLR